MTCSSLCRRLFSVTSLCLIAVVCGRSLKSADVEDEVNITIPSPNITIVRGNEYVCKSIDIPKGGHTLTKIVPKPLSDFHIHMVVTLCDKPFGQHQEPEWECSLNHDEQNLPLLPRIPYCSPSGATGFPHFFYQFQGVLGDEGSMILPHGTGVPVGDGSDYQSMVVLFHFFRKQDLVNGSTAGPAVDVTLKPRRHGSTDLLVSSLTLEAIGFVEGKSGGTVAGSWTLRDASEIKIQLVYLHWHEGAKQDESMLTDIQVWIERSSGDRDAILRQDPHAFVGITDVSNLTSAVVREKDRLVVQCTYNNTSDRTLRIEIDDMCVIMVYYTMAGNERLEESDVYSVDPVYKNCLLDPKLNTTTWQMNYEGRSSYKGAGGDDCFLLE